MRFIVFTSENGKKYSSEKIDTARENIKNDLLNKAQGYVETIGTLGRYNHEGIRIEEHCYIIESLEEFSYGQR